MTIKPNTDQERFYRILKDAGARGVALADLTDLLYSQRVDGGPTWARECLYVMKAVLNRKLKGERIEVMYLKNWHFEGAKFIHGGKPRYRLVPCPH